MNVGFFGWGAVGLALSLSACGGGDIGEDCDTPGADDECVDEGVCDRREDGAVVCLLRCVAQEDCSATESCNGVTGSNLKACHPKTK